VTELPHRVLAASADLRVARARVRRVRIPLTPDQAGSMYVASATPRTIVELETVDGIVGLGEAPGVDEVFSLVQRCAARVVGQDLRDRRQLQQRFAPNAADYGNGRHGNTAYAALEAAAWDAIAQSYDVPFHVLLGAGTNGGPIEVACPIQPPPFSLVMPGGAQTKVQTKVMNVQRVDDTTRYALAQSNARGFHVFRYQGAGVHADLDLITMRAIRAALGSTARLQFDAGAGYTPVDAINLCRQLEDVKAELIIDPTEDLEGLSSVRAHVDTPIGTSRFATQPDHLASLARRPSVNIILASIGVWGGVLQYIAMLRAADLLGLEVGIESGHDTGIGTALNLHVATAFPQIHLPVQSSLHTLVHSLVTGADLTVRNGCMRPPTGPGLGVRLDPVAMRTYTIDDTSFDAPAYGL
jgi:glucarate dehydratase